MCNKPGSLGSPVYSCQYFEYVEYREFIKVNEEPAFSMLVLLFFTQESLPPDL